MEFLEGKVYPGCWLVPVELCTWCAVSLELTYLSSSDTSWYGVGQYYVGSQNDSTVNVYYLNSFDNVLRSYGKLVIPACSNRGGACGINQEHINRELMKHPGWRRSVWY